jgi:hypothetical protein
MAIDKKKQSIKSLLRTKKLFTHIKTKKTQQKQQHHTQQDEEGQGDSERNPATPNTRKWLENGKKGKNTKGLK